MRKSFTHEKKRRATGFCRAYDIVFFWVIRWQAAFPGAGCRFSGAFTDANAVPWSPGGEAGRRHVSSSACQCKARLQPSQCPTRRKRERFAAFLGEVLVVPPPSLPQPIIYNTSSKHPMTFRGPQILHNFTRIKGGWNFLTKTQTLWTRLYYNIQN